MNNLLFRYVKKMVPKISETELIALRSGTTCIDKKIFEGKVSIPEFKSEIYEKNKLKGFDRKILSSNIKHGISAAKFMYCPYH